MKTNSFSRFTGLLLAGMATLALTGCLTRDDSGEAADLDNDGQSAFLVSETDQMGQALTLAGTDSMATLGIATSLKGELLLAPLSYHEDCQCLVRRARYNGSKGHERVRLDTVRLFDSAGAALDSLDWDRVAKITYSRNVDHEKGAKQSAVRFDLVVDIESAGGARTGIWNGNLIGSYNGQEFKSGTLTDVKRPLVDGRFGFPGSGTLEVTRPVFQYQVVFLGDGKAKATLTNRKTGRIRVIWVDGDYAEKAE